MQDGMTIQTPPLDRVLLDAPCTGEGLIVSQPRRRKSKSILNSYQLQKVQISLLKRAINLLKPGGRCVYSTCSITTPENEEVIATVLDKVKIVEANEPVGTEEETPLAEDLTAKATSGAGKQPGG